MLSVVVASRAVNYPLEKKLIRWPLETLARRKPGSGGGQPRSQFCFDSVQSHFPNWMNIPKVALQTRFSLS